MVLQVPIPSWPGAQDTLSVWKRTTIITLDGDNEESDGDFGLQFKYIPSEHQLDLVRVCPETAALVDWEDLL